jgi:hypothetical protein
MSKKTSLAERAKASAARVREAMKANQEELVQDGATAAGAAAIGYAQKTPQRYASLPSLFGIGRTPTLAVAGMVAKRFAPKGLMHDAVAGATRSAIAIAAFQFSKGEDPDAAADAWNTAHSGAPVATQGIGRLGSGAAKRIRSLESVLTKKRAAASLRGRAAELDDEDED